MKNIIKILREKGFNIPENHSEKFLSTKLNSNVFVDVEMKSGKYELTIVEFLSDSFGRKKSITGSSKEIVSFLNSYNFLEI